jgi:hypothetical protein
MLKRLGLILASLVLLAGCSVHPLPEDFAGYDTVQITARIRCEVRDAIRGHIVGSLLRRERVEKHPQYAELAERLRSGDIAWRDLRRHLKEYRVDDTLIAIFERYNSAVIGYSFIFDLEEKNAHNGSVDLLGAITNGTVKLNVQASNDLIRGNKREFRLVDSFEFLVSHVADVCDPRVFPIQAHRHERNIVYPITGSLGLAELVRTFLTLNQSGNLLGFEAPPNQVEIPTIVETMTFTTQFVAGATPSIELAARRSFSPVKAHIGTTNTRKDLHKVVIVIKLPPNEWIPKTIAEKRVFVAPLGIAVVPGSPRLATTTQVTNSMKSVVAAELAAQPGRELIEATIQFRSRFGGALVD